MTVPRIYFVYRCYDEDGRLLYVGMTRNLDQRRKHHHAMAPWFSQVSRVRLDGPFTRAGALDLETWRIHREAPIHNRRRCPSPRGYDTWRCLIEGRPTPWASPEEIAAGRTNAYVVTRAEVERERAAMDAA